MTAEIKKMKNGNGSVNESVNDKNPSGEKSEKADLALGATFKLSESDGETVKTVKDRLDALNQLLGEKVAAFRFDELRVLQSIEKTSQELSVVLAAVGSKNGLELDSQQKRYHFDTDQMVFTRTA